MASSLSRRIRMIVSLLFTLFLSTCCAVNINQSEFYSLSVVNFTNKVKYNANVKEIVFEVRGRNIYNGMQIKVTQTAAGRNTKCGKDFKNYSISDIWTKSTEARYVLVVPESVNGNIYFCLPHAQNVNSVDVFTTPRGSFYKWFHQGDDIFVNLSRTSSIHGKSTNQSFTRHLIRKRRDESNSNKITVFGMRIDTKKGTKEPHFDENGVPELLVNVPHTVRLFGTNFTDRMRVAFTENNGTLGGPCYMSMNLAYKVETEVINGEVSTNTVKLSVTLPPSTSKTFYLCISEGTSMNGTFKFVHQGSLPLLTVKSFQQLVPLWAAILIICTCLSFSALFSGLNLGLMSLDRTELKILCNTGTTKEKEYAKAIQPVRNHGNYLLCSILLGNVFVNSIFTILLDSLTSGVIAVIFSTLAIVMFGEITPQAICSRYGLAVGAKTILITKFVMLITAPLSYPISKVLDCILGEEIGNVYNRERLKELVKMTTGENDLDKDEVNIISGALELRKKTVSEVMTRIEDVFMLDIEATLNFETVSEIMKSGYSRIPVYDGNRNNIVTMLYIKDLAFVDPDDNTPLKTLCKFYQNPCNFVFDDVTLDVMFRIFKEGNKGHMAFVHRVNNEGEGDPFYETIGLITLEDVIEELIQAEIMDETDVFTDNRTKRRRNADRTKQDFTIFAERRADTKIRISAQMTLATYQYLSTSVEFFKLDSISERVLRRLLKQDVIYHIKKVKDWRKDPTMLIYQQGKPADYFVLLLEGHVQVTVGREGMTFESGPFTYFGTQALVQNIGIVDSPTAPSTLGSLQSLNMDAMVRQTFLPDYSVRASTDILFVRIRRNLYLAAKRATLMERSQFATTTTLGDQFDDEMEKLLHSLEDDGSIGRVSPEPNSKISDNQRDSITVTGPLPQNNTSKTASPRSAPSPTSPQQTNARDSVNGPMKKPSIVGDGLFNMKDIIKNDEEVSLLTKK